MDKYGNKINEMILFCQMFVNTCKYEDDYFNSIISIIEETCPSWRKRKIKKELENQFFNMFVDSSIMYVIQMAAFFEMEYEESFKINAETNLEDILTYRKYKKEFGRDIEKDIENILELDINISEEKSKRQLKDCLSVIINCSLFSLFCFYEKEIYLYLLTKDKHQCRLFSKMLAKHDLTTSNKGL